MLIYFLAHKRSATEAGDVVPKQSWAYLASWIQDFFPDGPTVGSERQLHDSGRWLSSNLGIDAVPRPNILPPGYDTAVEEFQTFVKRAFNSAYQQLTSVAISKPRKSNKPRVALGSLYRDANGVPLPSLDTNEVYPALGNLLQTLSVDPRRRVGLTHIIELREEELAKQAPERKKGPGA